MNRGTRIVWSNFYKSLLRVQKYFTKWQALYRTIYITSIRQHTRSDEKLQTSKHGEFVWRRLQNPMKSFKFSENSRQKKSPDKNIYLSDRERTGVLSETFNNIFYEQFLSCLSSREFIQTLERISN